MNLDGSIPGEKEPIIHNQIETLRDIIVMLRFFQHLSFSTAQ